MFTFFRRLLRKYATWEMQSWAHSAAQYLVRAGRCRQGSHLQRYYEAEYEFARSQARRWRMRKESWA